MSQIIQQFAASPKTLNWFLQSISAYIKILYILNIRKYWRHKAWRGNVRNFGMYACHNLLCSINGPWWEDGSPHVLLEHLNVTALTPNSQLWQGPELIVQAVNILWYPLMWEGIANQYYPKLFLTFLSLITKHIEQKWQERKSSCNL